MPILSVLIISLIAISIVGVLSIGLRNRIGRTKKTKNKAGNRESIIKEANKKLALNPKDPEALESLADLYYFEGEHKKALKTYQLLLNQPNITPAMNDGHLHFRYGLSAMQCQSWTEAHKGLMMAQIRRPNAFEVNANLGKLEYMRKNYDRTIAYLKKALVLQPDHIDSLKYLGRSLYKLKRYSKAVGYLNQAVSTRPDDKESTYALARCQYEIFQLNIALKLFQHLHSDPTWGPHAALYSGTIHAKKQAWENAIADYQIGLDHENIDDEIQKELQYRLAEAFNKTKHIDRALAVLNELYESSPNYKDVDLQIKRYRELNSNENLKTYLLASNNEFIALCKKITQALFPKSTIVVNDLVVKNIEYVDMLTEIKTITSEDIVFFRFIRTEGQVGDLFVRDLHAHVQELRANRTYCLSGGTFTPESLHFAEVRPIDLFEKTDLLKILKSIDPSEVGKLR